MLPFRAREARSRPEEAEPSRPAERRPEAAPEPVENRRAEARAAARAVVAPAEAEGEAEPVGAVLEATSPTPAAVDRAQVERLRAAGPVARPQAAKGVRAVVLPRFRRTD